MNSLAPSSSLLLKPHGRPKLLSECAILCFVRFERLTMPLEATAQLHALRHFDGVKSKVQFTPVEYVFSRNRSNSIKHSIASDTCH